MVEDNVECPRCGNDEHVKQYHLKGDVMHIWCGEHGMVVVSGWSDRFKSPDAEW